MKHYWECQKNPCAGYTSVYEPIFTCDSSPLAHNICLNDTLSKATEISWWNILTHSFQLFLDFFITHRFRCIDCHQDLFSQSSQLPYWANQLRNVWCGTHPAALGFLNHRFHYLSLYRIDRLPLNRFRCRSDYPSHHCSLAKFSRQTSFQVRYAHHSGLGVSRFYRFGGHSIFQFVLQGGPLQTKLLAKVMFPTS